MSKRYRSWFISEAENGFTLNEDRLDGGPRQPMYVASTADELCALLRRLVSGDSPQKVKDHGGGFST